MTYPKGEHPGAVWRKSDFQVHTPRDAGWSGSPNLPGGTAEFEQQREAWADTFVAACLEAGIAAVAITDHHDLVMLPYVARAIRRSVDAYGKLWLFPGMEITCDDSVQCLVLFDQGTDHNDLNRLFGKMPNVPAPDMNAGRAPQTNLCGKEIREFLGAVHEDQVLRGKQIVLPHASKGGHKDILRQGFHPRFADLEVDGVYNEKAFSDLDTPTRRKIYGETPEWGDRRRGIITTGDNRMATFERLGRNACWIRLGEPTTEAIRQALLADEARITYEEPDIPSQRLLELRVNSSLTGPDFLLKLNDGFNALIGGRGSGKSAILEYLRFALGRSTVDAKDDPSTNREKNLINTTLTTGFVEVELDRDGVRETWRRTLDRQAVITVTVAGASPVELPIIAAQERFRARAYSQKQLSTMVRLESADEQITGIAAAESVDRRHQAQQEIEDAERAVRAAFQQVVQSWAAQAALNRAMATTSDLRRRIESIRGRLEEGGLSPDQQAILDLQPIYDRTSVQLAAAKAAIAEKKHQLQQITTLALGNWDELVRSPNVEGARRAVLEFNESYQSALRMIQEALGVADEKLVAHNIGYTVELDEFAKSYAAASMAQSHLTNLLADFKRLTGELQHAEAQLRDAETKRARLSDADAKLAEAKETLNRRLAALREILSEASERARMMSREVLRAHVEEEATPHRFMEALLDLCERCNIRDLDVRCRERVTDVAGEGRKVWEELIHRLLRLRESMVLRGDGAEVDPRELADLRTAFGWELTDKQARLVLGRLDDDRMSKLLSAWASPFIRFEYRDRGTYMPFERASPGQQASALLTLLLNQEAGTLIIDQPEDDLDNRVIMSIVKLLQTTKRQRQLIFATHNPNFVVNGDADKIVALMPSVEPNASEAAAASRILIEHDGAIETLSIRQAITDTMEGGVEAFELRGRKYSIL